MQTKPDQLLRNYQEIHEGPNWIEVSLLDALTSVTSNLAFTNPPGGRNSIAKIVCHLVYIRGYLIKKLQGDQISVIDQEASFDTTALGSTPETAWQNLLTGLNTSFATISRILPDLNPELLNKQALPRDYNLGYLVASIIQHEAYHLGQLVFLKNQLLALTQNR